MSSRHLRAVGIALVLAALAVGVSLFRSSAPSAPSSVRVGSTRVGATLRQWLIVGPAKAGAVLAVVRRIDRRLGYPKPGYLGDRYRTPVVGAQHAVWPYQCAPGLFAVPLGPEEQTELATVESDCATWSDAGALPDGGSVPAVCTKIAAFPNTVGDAAYHTICDAALADAGGASSLTCVDTNTCDPPDDADGGVL